MNKTTEALKLAEEALLGSGYYDTTQQRKALAAIREVLAESKPAPDGRIPKTVFTIEDIGKAAEMGRQAGMIDALAEPVKQEPVALQDIEQYRMQMAGISTAALGYWKEGDSIHPDYDTPALRDVAALYAKYAKLYAEPVQPVNQEPVGEVARYEGKGNLTVYADYLPTGTKIYAAPVDAKAIRAEAFKEAAEWCEAKQSYSAMHANTEFAAGIRGLK